MNLDKYAEKIAQKDAVAFNSLYEKINRIVFSICYSILKEKYIAEDITQETFSSVWEKTSEFRGVGYKTWILTIARNKSLNELKKKNRVTNVDFNENPNSFGDYSINEKVEKINILEIISRNLDEEERQIVLLKNSGMKIKEIAEYLGKPRGTVSWKYSQIIQKLQYIIRGN